jgi:2-methylcitrate dehydratase
VAHKIIGGGEEGGKYVVRVKEEADHSPPYLLAVAVLDGQVMPEQYAAQRILRSDVQQLLRKVSVRPRQDLSRRFPAGNARGGTNRPARRPGVRSAPVRF